MMGREDIFASFLSMKMSIVCLIGLMTMSPVHAQEIVWPKAFDTSAHLDFCANAVPNHPLALAMDTKCVGHALELCEIAVSDEKLSSCFEEVTGWLNHAVQSHFSALPAEILEQYLAASDLEKFVNKNSDALVFANNQDCQTNHILWVRAEVTCAFRDSLSAWQHLRAMQRLTAFEPPE